MSQELDTNLPRDAAEGGAVPVQAAAAGSAVPGQRPLPPDAIAIVGMRNLVLFPGMILPAGVGRERSVAAAQEAVRTDRPVGLLLQRDPSMDNPQPKDLYWVGTVANVMRYVTTPDGGHHLVCQGEQRFRVLEFLDGYPFLAARIQRIPDAEVTSTEMEARLIELRNRAQEVLELLPEAPAELANAIRGITSASLLADLVAGFMDLKPEEKQELLETFDVATRVDKVLKRLSHRIEVLQLSKKISDQTRESMEDRQREFLLREQMKTIQKELGESDDDAKELAELAKAIEEAGMPEDVLAQARKELKRLQRMSENAAEYSMVRTYLDTMVELPWQKASESRIDIPEARRILDEDHFGLDKIKRRILEYLAVRKLNPAGKSPILCFVGPPGVGKTSLGQSIARATGRKFVRASLGGVHDEAEIRGHRRTYIGALPGSIIQSIRKAETNNPVFMLDEIDKLGAGGFHGDPASALLEVLDPEQNATFHDNYLAVPFDLSKVMFIATANVLETIPGPLRDRMEVIQLPGYTQEEKLEIARRYLVARQLESNGLKPEQVEIADDTLRAIIADYTREAGVRSLEREIGAVLRNVAVRIAEGVAERVQVTAADLATILGPRRFENEVAMRAGVPGVATGLAWTPVGGDILFIEASKVPGSGRLILTGQLGDVMKESAQAALSLVKARLTSFGLREDLLEKSDIHVHVPAGATPKDGPSAGVAITMALTSLLTGRPVRSDTAMTGEISLRGLVLPVGGIKEKVLAAQRAGISRVLLPARNRRDFEEIPEETRGALEFVWLETVDDAIGAALGERAAVPTPVTARA
ncbi:MAG: endopeptidase La [Burkholderiales bacterium]|nr:endopeptidase La [Burkholderiales bacterium]